MLMRRTWIAIGALVVLGLFIYATRAILLPFVSGLALAYLLDPLADKLEARKFPRWVATATILGVFVFIILSVLAMLLPFLQAEVNSIKTHLPEYMASLRPQIDAFLSTVGGRIGGMPVNADSLLADITDKVIGGVGNFTNGLLGKGAAVFNMLALLLITPVVAFFLLRDWDLIVKKIDGWLPKKSGPIIRRLAKEIDNALAGFVRGQTTVAIIMATLYAVGWSLVGLEYSLLLGLVAGILAFIPFAGAVFACILAMVVALGQMGGDVAFLTQVFSVFAIVQILEGAVFTPRLIGAHVGLHPVWVLFAIFAGGEVMGFVGILIALPVAAAIGVLVRYFIESYLDSSLHKGPQGDSSK